MITNILRILLTRSLKTFKFDDKYSKNLKYENIDRLGLYIHIPFCRKICSFCPYCKDLYNESKVKEYKKSLIKEINLVGSTLKNKKNVTSLYFGGGTPCLMVDDLNDIIKEIKKYFTINEGIGVELHPNDITKYNLAKLKESNVNMISIGIQSFQNNSLKILGREDTEIFSKLNLVKSFNFDVVDMDLIFGLPNQTEKTIIDDIKTAFDKGATQVSTYPFIDFTFAKKDYKALNKKTKQKMLSTLYKYAQKNDLRRTSVWTFAKKNTNKYSSVTRDNFIGFGVSAATLLEKEFKINTFNIKAYIDRINKNELPTSLTLNFTLRQRIVYYLFWRAYSLSIDKKDFKKTFNINIDKLYPVEIFICKKLGLLIEKDNSYKLTEKSAYYYHLIEQKYTNKYIDKMWSTLRLEEFPKSINLK